MELCPASVPQYFIPGNRDIGNEKFKDEALIGFEKQFMPGFYFFQVGQRYFITNGFAQDILTKSTDIIAPTWSGDVTILVYG